MSLDDSSLDASSGDSPGSDDLLDIEVARVLESYLAAMDAGQPADPRRLLEDHPHLAGRLRACLRVLRVAEQAAQSVTGAPEVAQRHSERPGSTVPHGSGTPQSSLSTLDFGPGEPPQVLLREPAEAGIDEPLLRPYSTAMSGNGGSVGRYQLQGEIARGGMGAILRGRDVDLGRELAIKVLLESHRGDADVVRRFVEEAQIGGQLQHPGIVPVYELGAFPDRRPFFAMKLVKGRTLSALLAERAFTHGSPPSQPDDSGPDTDSPRPAGERVPEGRVRGHAPDAGIKAESIFPLESRLQAVPGPAKAGTPTSPNHADLPRFLSIFEQVCQTMAYAHARGVIHRDLKPSNIMVGSFGEVQVMDWGLAKVLASGGVADQAGAQPTRQTVIMTVRSGSAGSGGESQAGSVLGTPSYMAPEQARGEIDRIDERSDVFGLGAILCEILTGQPPFVATSREETRAMAARGDLAGAVGRLKSCGADAELIDLARSCLRHERNRRPRNAGEVARRVSSYMAGVQERLKAAELARVEMQTRAKEEAARRVLADELAREARARADKERKLRRMTASLAASVLGVFVLGGTGWAYLARQRLEQKSRDERAFNRADALYAEAERTGDDPVRWLAASEATRALERELVDAPDELTRQRCAKLVHDVVRGADSAERDQALLSKLIDVRARADDYDGIETDADYADAFREAGIDVSALAAAQFGAVIRSRPSTVKIAIAAALDDWAAVRRDRRDDTEGAVRLLDIARIADPDPWRNRLREVLRDSRSQELAAHLRQLAKSAPFDQLPAVSFVLLGGNLLKVGLAPESEVILREGQRRHPGDVWLNTKLAECLERLARNEDAVRYYIAARSLRPEIAHSLAHALERKGEVDQAITVFQDLARIRTGDGRHLACLGIALKARGRSYEARKALDAAIVDLRGATARRQGRSSDHVSLGMAFQHSGQLDAATVEYRTALRLQPRSPTAHNDLGNVLKDQGKLGEAIIEYQMALGNTPTFAGAHTSLAVALYLQGKLHEAIVEFREAIRVEPGNATAYVNLGALLCDGRHDYSAAESMFRNAIRLKPDDPNAHQNLGACLANQSKLPEAIAEFREAIRLKPDDADAHTQLAHALRSQGDLATAAELLRKARDLAKADPQFSRMIEQELAATEKLASLSAGLGDVLAGKLKPRNAAETLDFARLCYDKRIHGSSARLWNDAFQAQTELAADMRAQHRYNAACAAALAGCGQGKDNPPLDEPTKARWRKQALDWLKADLAAWSKILKEGPAETQQSIPKTLLHWKSDADLAGMRDAEALKRLPEAEQKACRALWAEVDALLKLVGNGKH
jgi:serine/threonine-protein kinase